MQERIRIGELGYSEYSKARYEIIKKNCKKIAKDFGKVKIGQIQ